MRRPSRQNLNEDLQWFGQCLGLFSLRDKDKSMFRIFIELLKAARQGEGMTSDDLAERLQLTRGTVVHHLHKLLESGIVTYEGRWYVLRDPRLERLVDEIEKDLLRACSDLKAAAQQIDERMRE